MPTYDWLNECIFYQNDAGSGAAASTQPGGVSSDGPPSGTAPSASDVLGNDVIGDNAGTSDALDGRTAGMVNRGGPNGEPIISDEAGPEGGINQVATSDMEATTTNQPSSTIDES